MPSEQAKITQGPWCERCLAFALRYVHKHSVPEEWCDDDQCMGAPPTSTAARIAAQDTALAEAKEGLDVANAQLLKVRQSHAPDCDTLDEMIGDKPCNCHVWQAERILERHRPERLPVDLDRLTALEEENARLRNAIEVVRSWQFINATECQARLESLKRAVERAVSLPQPTPDKEMT